MYFVYKLLSADGWFIQLSFDGSVYLLNSTCPREGIMSLCHHGARGANLILYLNRLRLKSWHGDQAVNEIDW